MNLPKLPNSVQTLFSKKPHQPTKLKERDGSHRVHSAKQTGLGALLALEGIIAAKEHSLGSLKTTTPWAPLFLCIKYIYPAQPHKQPPSHQAVGTVRESFSLAERYWTLFCMTRARCLHTEQNSRGIWAGNDPGIQGICYQCKLLRKVHSSPLSKPDHPGPYLVCAPCARVKCEWEPSHGHVGWAGTPPPGAEQRRNPWAMVAHLIPGITVSSPKHDAQGREKKNK